MGSLLVGHNAPIRYGRRLRQLRGLSDDADQLTAALYGPHQERLDRIRTAYDSEGVFASAARRP